MAFGERKQPKNFNYSVKREKLVKELQNITPEELSRQRTIDAFLAAGYTVSSAEKMLAPNGGDQGIKEVIRNIWPVEERVKQTKEITEEARQAKQFGSSLKGIEMASKMAGDYAATEQNINLKGTVKHEHELGLGTKDFLEYKRKKLAEKQFIDGEVVDG